MLLLWSHCSRSEESLAPRKMRSMPAKVKHPGAGNSEAERGCDAQVNRSLGLGETNRAQCRALGGGSKTVVTQPAQAFLFLPSALVAESIAAV